MASAEPQGEASAEPTTLVVFAGGKGTRLGGLGREMPKPAVPVRGRPLITYLIHWAFEQGLQRVIVAAGYKHEILKRSLIDYYRLDGDVRLAAQKLELDRPRIPEGCEVIIRSTGLETETAERLWRVRDLLAGGERFMVTYGDTLTDLRAESVVQVSTETRALVTMCIGRPDGRYGEVVSDGRRVVAFQEKKRPEFYVNRGFFVVDPRLFQMWQNDYRSFESDVMPALVGHGQVACHVDDCWFHSVDSEKDLQVLEDRMVELDI